MVNVACLCPPNAAGEVRHPAGDEITLREHLDFRAALTARNTIQIVKREPGATVADVLAALTETYLLVGIESWSLVDAKGEPIEVTKAAIREHLFSRLDIAMEVGDVADELYFLAVIAPLAARASKSSPLTPTDGSTSATTPSSSPQKPSRPSSIASIPMADTAKTSPSLAGGSSSLQNSA
jgi:hypothetical protein